MALFRRKKNESVMPEEVRNFYASEHRDRKGMAWLLAVVTLLVTFLIAAALFFGGRWLYRAVFDNGDDTSTSQEESAEEASPEKPTDTDDSKKSDSDRSTSPGSSSNQSGTGTPGSSTGTSSTNTTQTPVTGPSELVNTGPGDE